MAQDALEVVFLGHQGWMFSGSAGGALLVDPLLVEPFGHGGHIGRVYPPRRLAPEEMPPVEAVLLTHEHEDHFSIPSLDLLAREIPVYLSARSSAAGAEALAALGFSRVVRIAPGERIALRGLEVLLFTPNHVGANAEGEWDVLPFLVRTPAAGCSFFSSVDAGDTPALVEQVLATGRIGAWSIAHNGLDPSVQRIGRGIAPPEPLGMAAGFLGLLRALRSRGQAPAVLFCGNGFAFDGEREWLNRHYFPVDLARMSRALQLLYPAPVLAPAPGDRLVIDPGGAHEAPRPDFLGTAPRERWPDRSYRRARGGLEAYAPASGRRRLDEAGRARLVEELERFARHLYGSELFKGLLSLTAEECAERKPTVAFRLLDEAAPPALVAALELSEARFRLVEDADPAARYVAGVECWAADLLGLLAGELAPSALAMGRSRVWCSVARKLGSGLDTPLWLYAHPLCRPESYRALYRAQIAATRGNARVRAAVA